MPREGRNLKLGREYPFAVRKVPWDALWHVQYYMRSPLGELYVTWDRVSRAEAVRASNGLVNQYNALPKRLRCLGSC